MRTPHADVREFPTRLLACLVDTLTVSVHRWRWIAAGSLHQYNEVTLMFQVYNRLAGMSS